MKKTLFLLVLFSISAGQLKSTILNVPGNYGSIQEAIDAAVDHDTVLVEQNTYFENIEYKGKNIIIASRFLTINDTGIISSTIIDGSANGSVVKFRNGEDSTAMLIGFTLKNGKTKYGGGIYIESASPTIKNCIIRNNTLEGTNPFGGGIYLRKSRSTIYGCEIMYNAVIGMNNSNGWGGGISMESCSYVTVINCKIHHNQVTSIYGGIGVASTKVKIIGCEITNNFCYSSGSGIGCQDSDLQLLNNTIANNKATLRGEGFYFIRSSPIIHNCIVWHNKGKDSFWGVNGWGGTPEIYYSNIQGGYDTLLVMNLEPMFVDTTAGDFRLKDNSPCIDAGNPDTSGLNLPMYDLYGNLRFQDGNNDGISAIDMGASEYEPQSVKVDKRMIPNYSKSYRLGQNYPNPFNSVTTISYQLPKPVFVNLSIFNFNGQLVERLVFGSQGPGYFSVKWNASKFGSGVYVYKITAGEFSASGKCLLLR
ncbi:right-handed parallel beta-helix repeat-containing protein [candidate division KSB1 bacterium]|nr:right-handed parallel beta-helix repeat-containing protein [candidate division KSB1 bacterium]